jgi:hypothetical protein
MVGTVNTLAVRRRRRNLRNSLCGTTHNGGWLSRNDPNREGAPYHCRPVIIAWLFTSVFPYYALTLPIWHCMGTPLQSDEDNTWLCTQLLLFLLVFTDLSVSAAA